MKKHIVAATNAIRALMPPGVQAPIVVSYNASSVPVLQLSLRSGDQVILNPPVTLVYGTKVQVLPETPRT